MSCRYFRNHCHLGASQSASERAVAPDRLFPHLSTQWGLITYKEGKFDSLKEKRKT